MQEYGFKSPDAMQEFHFSRTYAETGQLVHQDTATDAGGEWVRPRGVHIVDDKMVMGKFVGFSIITGTFTSVLPDSTVYMVPVAAGLAGIFVTVLGRTFFGPRTGYVGGVLVFFAPPLWYWASIPMTSSVLSASMIAGGYAFLFLFVRQPERTYPLAGLAVGLFAGGLTIRPDSAIYLGPAAVATLAALWRRARLFPLVAAAGLGATPLLQFALTNWRLYGGPLRTGQHVGHEWEGTSPPLETKQSTFFLQYIPENAQDLIEAFPLFVLMVIAPILVARANWGRMRERPEIWLYLFSVVGGLLAFSWMYFTVPPGGRTGIISFGSALERSMIRYFLALYMLAMPAVAYLATHILPVGRANLYRLGSILLVLAFAVSAVTVTADDLKVVGKEQEDLAKLAEDVFAHTPANAVVITDNKDKAIFPHRDVIPLQRMDPDDIARITAESAARLEDAGLPVYMIQNNRLGPEALRGHLAEHDYTIKSVSGMKRTSMWEVVPLEEARR